MTTDSAAGRRPASLIRRVTAAVARLQRQLSGCVHQRGDALACERGWDITTTTGRLGFAGRAYRDPRFAARPGAARPNPAPMQRESTQ